MNGWVRRTALSCTESLTSDRATPKIWNISNTSRHTHLMTTSPSKIIRICSLLVESTTNGSNIGNLQSGQLRYTHQALHSADFLSVANLEDWQQHLALEDLHGGRSLWCFRKIWRLEGSCLELCLPHWQTLRWCPVKVITGIVNKLLSAISRIVVRLHSLRKRNLFVAFTDEMNINF